MLYSSYTHLSRTLQENKSVKLYILEGYHLKGKRERKNSLSNNLQLLIIQMSVYLITPGIQVNSDMEMKLEVLKGKINGRDSFFEEQIWGILRRNCSQSSVVVG